ncbi:hypothetical protein IRJ41_008122 [Triplophysa rosa]|uniref:Uncharacterized protein n=1 Tax=Triplophysa rosa TaxID=992332 RepID=A0A9W7T9N7_TRIRA|nr:hypothetical protein IRJ41_008122 [Triplophysa rosa]
MEDKHTDGGVTGGGRLVSFEELNCAVMRFFIGKQGQELFCRSFRSQWECVHGITCQEILSDGAEKAEQLGEPIIIEKRGMQKGRWDTWYAQKVT